MNVLKRTVACIAMAGATSTVVGVVPANATFPGRNDRIALSIDPGNGAEINTIKPNGTALRQLTHVDGNALWPDWSPDGRTIVFEFDDAATDTCSVELMKADGSGLVSLSGNRGGCEGNPAFTPDGRRIVFLDQACGSCPQEIRSMNLHGGNRRTILVARHLDKFDPNVSPDGKTVSFVVLKSDVLLALYTVRMDGSHLKRIVPYSLDVGSGRHDWAPDGSHIVFTQYASRPNGKTPNLVAVRPDGSDLVQLTHLKRDVGGDVGAGAASYSPDGRWIFFRVAHPDERSSLWKMRADGSHQTRVAKVGFYPVGMDWGPQPT